jgi:hypothetical protein
MMKVKVSGMLKKSLIRSIAVISGQQDDIDDPILLEGKEMQLQALMRVYLLAANT